MPVVGQHEKPKETILVPKKVALAVILTHERPGLLTRTLDSLRAASPDLHIIVYDDGSTSPEKAEELDNAGVHVNREPKRGLVRTWMKVFDDISCALDLTVADDEGIVLLEDDLLFAPGWDKTLLTMAGGAADLGFKPGTMTCFRCHGEIQSEVRNLRGVEAYQTLGHGFQVNMVPAGVFRHLEVFEEAAKASEAGRHGLDVHLIGALSHRLGLTSFMSMESWVAHMGANNSIAADFGYVSYQGFGEGLRPELRRAVSDSIIEMRRGQLQ